jgi:uncharacterized protein YjiS (DUF1127 family)
MIAGARSRKPMDTAPVSKMAGRITAVAINRERGIFRKHAPVRVSPATTIWEISMTYAKYDRRPTAPIRTARRMAAHPGRNLYPGQVYPGQVYPDQGGLMLLSPLRDRAPARPMTTAWSRLAVKATTLCTCAGHALPSLMLAILSWAITEVLTGCAAYAEALYPLPAPLVADASAEAPSSGAKPNLSLVSAQTHGDKTRGRPPRHSAHAVAAIAAEWPCEMQAEPQVEARPARWRISLKAILIACWSRWCRAHDRRRAVEELRGMDDRTLRDIGISHSDIEHILRNGEHTEWHGTRWE